MEGGDGDAILLDVDTVLQSVGLADLADGVGHGVGVLWLFWMLRRGRRYVSRDKSRSI